MKKFLPAIAISFCFTAILISQLVINGQELSASQVEKTKSKYSLFENEYSKFKDKSSKGNNIVLNEATEPIVILNFWASWCRPCVTEFKALNELLLKYPGKIKVVGINNDTDEAKKKIKKIEEKHKLQFESVIDEKGDYADKFKITTVPASIIYHKGKVIKFVKKEYDFTSEEFLSLVEDHLK